ncbi:hypothetical protein [Bacillus sp. B-jedd]|uniref:hypothetical protein n=1 Tax=Bacillus sp. B-jedd TaxID=1476857 RepID=UPI000515652F|nr:hypothetical protein [Bacillus sp. B-jedd]CEG26288.1 hypothetical protein BN1002_01130 [Bacillus sp. B-jedd]
MKKLKVGVPMLMVIILIFVINGYSFTALSAAKSNTFLSKDAELMEHYDTGSSVIFLFKSDKQKIYQTVLSERSGLFFRSNASTNTPYSSDKIQTVGGMSFSNEKDEVTLLSLISYDEEVAYIEAGIEPNLKRKEINKGERIAFLFPFSEQIDSLHPIAFNKDGKKLYYLGYPKDTNIFKNEDFKWHRFEGQ